MTSCCRNFQCSLYIFLTFHIFKICIYVFSVILKFCFFLWNDFNFIIKKFNYFSKIFYSNQIYSINKSPFFCIFFWQYYFINSLSFCF